MPGRKVGRGSSKPIKTKVSKPMKIKASKPVKVKALKPVKVKPVKVEPVRVKPGVVVPLFPPLKIAPRSPPKTALSLPQRIEIAPRKSALSPRLKTSSSSPSLKSSSKSPFLSNPSARYPPAPSRLSGPSSTPKLKPSKSVPDFTDVRASGKLGGFLRSSKSSQTLKKQNGALFVHNRPPVPAPIFKSKSSSKLGQDPHQTHPSSSSKIKPTQTAVRGEKETVKKHGFFSRLFGINKSSESNKPKYPEDPQIPQPPKPLKKIASTHHPAPIHITKPNTATTASPVVKPNRVIKPSAVPVPSSTPGKLEARPVKHKQPIRPSVEAVDHRDRIRLTRPSKPNYKPTVDGGHQRYDYDTTYSQAPYDYDPRYGTSAYYGPDQSTSSAHGCYPDTTATHDSGYQSVDNSALYTPCTVCNVNPQYVDPNTGQAWPYCSDSCQAAANPQPQQALCTVCQINPQYVDPNTGAAHAYCSHGCYAAEAASQQAQHSQQQQVTATCSYPGCTLPATLYPDCSGWNYCGQSHEYYALKGCIYCRQTERVESNPLCQACDNTLSQYAPMLVEVPSDNKIFWDMTDQFTVQWLHPTKCPTVHAVYRIVGTQQNWNVYNSYCNQLEYSGQFAARGKHPGNESMLWHGTRRVCNLGDPGNTTLCMNPGCGLCSIIYGSFDISKVMTNTKWARFGAGIYTSSVSSKANDYSANQSSSNYKAMLLNNVAVGKAYETYHDKPTLVRPPHGCDSVYGRDGGSLNYDEVVVYTNEAIRPSWLVLYG